MIFRNLEIIRSIMMKKCIESVADDIISIIRSHQDELSDGFGWYENANTWNNIRNEIRKAIQNMVE